MAWDKATKINQVEINQSRVIEIIEIAKLDNLGIQEIIFLILFIFFSFVLEIMTYFLIISYHSGIKGKNAIWYA